MNIGQAPIHTAMPSEVADVYSADFPRDSRIGNGYGYDTRCGARRGGPRDIDSRFIGHLGAQLVRF
jgi:hypothetical protein